MKKFLLVGMALVFCVFFASCNGDDSASSASKPEVLRLSWFEGGYGREYLDVAVALFQEKYPNVEIEMEVSPKNHEQLRVQFIAGNPPDVFFPNEAFLDIFALIQDDQLRPLNDLLESDAPGVSGKFKDIFLPGVLDTGKNGDYYYLAPVFSPFHGLWYSDTLFAEHGWEIPETFDELFAVSEEIKSSGEMAAFTYQGLYPQYPLRVFLLPLIGAHGGKDALLALNSLEPGAWKSDAVLQAARDFRDYYQQYALEGTLALNHTQAQMEFINQRAAFIPCGTWLDNEMSGNWPDDFELNYLLPPVKQSKDGETFVVMNYSFFAIPADAANPEMAEEFLKLMYSPEVRKSIAESAGSTMPIKNNTLGLEEYLSPVLIQANEQLNQPGVQTYFASWRIWYKPLFKKVMDSMTEMVSGRITPEEFCEAVESEAERIRNSPDIVKY